MVIVPVEVSVYDDSFRLLYGFSLYKDSKKYSTDAMSYILPYLTSTPYVLYM